MAAKSRRWRAGCGNEHSGVDTPTRGCGNVPGRYADAAMMDGYGNPSIIV